MKILIKPDEVASGVMGEEARELRARLAKGFSPDKSGYAKNAAFGLPVPKLPVSGLDSLSGKATLQHTDSPRVEEEFIQRFLNKAQGTGHPTTDSPTLIYMGGAPGTGFTDAAAHLAIRKHTIEGNIPEELIPLMEQYHANANVLIDFETVREKLIPIFAKKYPELENEIVIDENGKVTDPRLREWVRFSLNYITTGTATNLAANGGNSIFAWGCAGATPENIISMKHRAEQHGKTLETALVATIIDLETALENHAEYAYETGRHMPVSQVLGLHKAFSSSFFNICNAVDQNGKPVLDSVYLYNYSLGELHLVASKNKGELEITKHDQEALDRFAKIAELDQNALGWNTLYPKNDGQAQEYTP